MLVSAVQQNELVIHGFPGGTSGKEPTCQCRKHRRCSFDPWIKKIPWGRAWQPTPVFLPGESHGQRNLAGYSPQGHKELDRSDLACTFRKDNHPASWIFLRAAEMIYKTSLLIRFKGQQHPESMFLQMNILGESDMECLGIVTQPCHPPRLRKCNSSA